VQGFADLASHCVRQKLFPGHPLTCARAWLRGLDRIVTVDPAFAALSDVRGTTRQAEGR